MKKLILATAVAGFMAIGFTSCKKDYTCKCTYDFGGQSQNYSFPIENASKSDAESACEYTFGGVTANCELQ